MMIEVNGKDVQIPKGTTLREIVSKENYVKGSIIGIVERVEKFVEEKEEFEIQTSKGRVTISLNGSEFASVWKDIFNRIAGGSVRWCSHQILAIGPFPTKIKIDRGLHQYKKWDLFFAVSGFDNQNTHLMIAKKDHEGEYGVNGGVCGRLMRGRHVIDLLEEGDMIRDIRPLTKERGKVNLFSTTDLNLPLKEGMAVYTSVHILLNSDAPTTCEHFFASTRENVLRIDESTSSYLCSKRWGINLTPEHVCEREKYSVTVRNMGSGAGNIYIYKSKRCPSPAHSVVGKIVEGTRLVDMAQPGDHITVSTSPTRMSSVGMTQADAEVFFNNQKIEQIRKGDVRDGAIIVEQKPHLTMDVLREKRVETTGIDANNLFKIKFFEEEAPNTVSYIKRVSKLTFNSIGKLIVHFTYPKMSNLLLKGDVGLVETLLPENPPKNISKKGEVGVTNMSKSNKGLVGIRLEDSSEFGPTGEVFHATNIAGVVLTDLSKLKGLRDGDVLYLREAKDEC